MPKITPKEKDDRNTKRKTIFAKTTEKSLLPIQSYQWWFAENDEDLCQQTISTANYLQKNQQYRIKGASIFSKIYSGKGLMSYALNSKALDTSNQLPVRRPTMNVTQSCIDTLVSRITQNKPKPTFLTDGGNYKEQMLSDELNSFIMGEFYRCKAYELGEKSLRSGCIFGDGFIKVLEKDNKVALERRLDTQLFADKNDAWNGSPRQLIELQLSDRNVIQAMYPDARMDIKKANKAIIDGSGESQETVSDQIIVIEAWHLPSSEDADDGRHVIVCSAGVILDEVWEKDYFPFAKISYNPHEVGYFSQGLVEMGMGTQLGIDQLLGTITESIRLMGVPVIWMDELSKILETSFNNRIGTIGKYRGTLPTYMTPNCVAPEMYAQLKWLIESYYQMAGISQLSASSQKPAGLDSGEAQRVYLDTQDTRFASLENRYANLYIDLAYLMIDKAKDIANREGSYSTVYPGKDGTRKIDLPKAAILRDTYVIQCFDESMLPSDPAGRQAKLSEMLASGEIDKDEYRRLSANPDLKAADQLAFALKDRILMILDDIVSDGKLDPPDPFILDPTDMATTLTVQTINYYSTKKLEEKKMQMLRDFFSQLQALKAKAMPPQPALPPQAGPNPNQAPPPAAPPTPQSAASAA